MQNTSDGNDLKQMYSRVSTESADDLIFRNHALFELGKLYFEKCDFPNAVDCLEKVKTEALQFHLYDNYFKANYFLLRIHAERLHFDKHESLIREILQVGAAIKGFDRFQARLLFNQGIAAVYKRSQDEAISCFLKAEKELLLSLEDTTLTQKAREELHLELLKVRYCIAVDHNDCGRAALALQHVEKLRADILDFNHGEKAFEHSSLHEIEASLLLFEGKIFRESGDFARSLEVLWDAHALLKSNRCWSQYYYVLLGLGQTYQMMGNVERANLFFELVSDALSSLELNQLKKILDQVIKKSEAPKRKLLIDRERRLIIEPTVGEVHFDRRFVLLEILYLLASKPGKVFSKEELVSQIWGESYNPMVHDSKVYTSISRLRKLLEPDFRAPIYIMNERDGYVFSPSVHLEILGESRVAGLGASQAAGINREIQRGMDRV